MSARSSNNVRPFAKSSPSLPEMLGLGDPLGMDGAGHQRYWCKECGITYAVRPASPIAPMGLPVDRTVLVLSLLVEGTSIRAAERITGHHRDTIMRLLALVGGRRERLLNHLLVGVEVQDVEADEIWGYVSMKEKTKARLGIEDARIGDATPTSRWSVSPSSS